MSVALSGCISPESLRKDTDKQLSTCLHVGMTIDAAEKCAQKAKLSLSEEEVTPKVRIYYNSAPSFWPIVYSVVRVELHFSEASQLESWSSTSSADGI